MGVILAIAAFLIFSPFPLLKTVMLVRSGSQVDGFVEFTLLELQRICDLRMNEILLKKSKGFCILSKHLQNVD